MGQYDVKDTRMVIYSSIGNTDTRMERMGQGKDCEGYLVAFIVTENTYLI